MVMKDSLASREKTDSTVHEATLAEQDPLASPDNLVNLGNLVLLYVLTLMWPQAE